MDLHAMSEEEFTPTDDGEEKPVRNELEFAVRRMRRWQKAVEAQQTTPIKKFREEYKKEEWEAEVDRLLIKDGRMI